MTIFTVVPVLTSPCHSESLLLILRINILFIIHLGAHLKVKEEAKNYDWILCLSN